jgi:hypothetical protein
MAASTASESGREEMAIMNTMVILGVVGIVGLTGCASVSEGVASMQPESASQPSSVRVGEARLLDPRVNPSAGVRVTAEGDALVVRFAHPGRGTGEIERMDPISLQTISKTVAPVDRSSSGGHPQRVVLDGGRFIVCWKSGDAEQGYRAMAQAFNASDGSPRGAPVAISPADADVSGSLSVATADGHNVVATFAASTGDAFAAYAVPIEAL